MYLFIFVSLSMAFLLKEEGALRTVFLSKYACYLGVFLLCINLLAVLVGYKKIAYKIRYDLFAVGAILVWFSYWPAFFREGSPLFYFYPLYFALITALFSLVFIKQREQIDSDALVWLQWLSDSGRFNPVIVMISVCISLFFPQQFMLFPLTVSLLVMRFALACCLENE